MGMQIDQAGQHGIGAPVHFFRPGGRGAAGLYPHHLAAIGQDALAGKFLPAFHIEQFARRHVKRLRRSRSGEEGQGGQGERQGCVLHEQGGYREAGRRASYFTSV